MMRFLLFTLLISLFSIYATPAQSDENQDVIRQQLKSAAALFGFDFTESELDLMLKGDVWNAEDYKPIRERKIGNSTAPALIFNPLPNSFHIETRQEPFQVSDPQLTDLPKNPDDLAYRSVRDLAYLIENHKITSTELTRMYLARLKKYGSKLQCVVTLTEERALRQAAKADAEIAAGTYRGLLHGIPYGVKDLLAVKGYKTTWGAKPYENQVIDEDAEVIRELGEAGAVLIAKLTLGALAMGDIWFGGKTRNPWNIEQGSSGSSAGPASAVAAGLVPFAIGSETNGSIVSPCIRCGATGLRPTFGRVSRSGAMALSWSMDKLGPICRTAEDCAIVFNAIIGPDDSDPSQIEAPFNYDADVDVKNLRFGYLKTKMEDEYDNEKFDRNTIEQFKSLGVSLTPVEFPDFEYSSLGLILSAEAAAAFDELTRSGQDDLLVNQSVWAWPNTFRKARFIPAVEYIQANRIRTQLIEEMDVIMKNFDVVIAPPFNGNSLLLTNLTGHPCVVFPNGFKEDGTPTGITLIGRLFGEAELLEAARAYQQSTDFHLKHPELNAGAE
ncbi:MAG: amidase [bacterium]|nr:amidase [bacterium]